MIANILIRGGATVGELHHKGGDVIGNTLIEAYKLESCVANYPRIAVSRKLYSQVKTIPRNTLLLEDLNVDPIVKTIFRPQ